MNSIIAPEVDMMTVSKSSSVARGAILGFVPKSGLNIVDQVDLDRIDNFYLECQKYRDYYRDPYNKLQKPLLFSTYQGRCGTRVDRSVEMLCKPVDMVVETKPVVYPAHYGYGMSLDGGLIVGGKYNQTSCIKYKR